MNAKNFVIDQSKFMIDGANLSANGSIRMIEKTPDKIIYETNNNGPGLGIFSEIYYPAGWTAKIDGSDVEIKRANYILRALEIPSGTHEVVFEFRPTSFYAGGTVSIISQILIVLSLLGAIFMEVKRSKQ